MIFRSSYIFEEQILMLQFLANRVGFSLSSLEKELSPWLDTILDAKSITSNGVKGGPWTRRAKYNGDDASWNYVVVDYSDWVSIGDGEKNEWEGESGRVEDDEKKEEFNREDTLAEYVRLDHFELETLMDEESYRVTEAKGRRAERHHGLCRLGRRGRERGTKDEGKLIARERRKRG